MARITALTIGYYRWLKELVLVEKILLSFIFAGITGISAQIRIPLPFTPVPITGQVFVVLLAGILLRGYYGGLSMLLYFLLGIAGVPWFSGFKPALPFGPTTGYIIGFIPASVLVGLLAFKNHKIHFQILIMFGAISIIYLFGALHLMFYLHFGWRQAIISGVLPFILPDILKAITAGFISRALVGGSFQS